MLAVAADVSREEGVADGRRAAIETFGGIDVLVNNVGTARGGGLLETIGRASGRRRSIRRSCPRSACRVWPCRTCSSRGGGVDRHHRVDLRTRGRRAHDLQRRESRRDQPGEVAGPAAGADRTSASTACRPGRSCSRAGRGGSGSRRIPRRSPSSSSASCRSAASARPRRSAMSSRSSRRRAPAGSAARQSSSMAVRADRSNHRRCDLDVLLVRIRFLSVRVCFLSVLA